MTKGLICMNCGFDNKTGETNCTNCGHKLKDYESSPIEDQSPDNLTQDNVNVQQIENRLKSQDRLKQGANWFYWIAGLSLINTIIMLSDGGWRFVAGLGITEVFIVIASRLSSWTAGMSVVLSILINILIGSVFVMFGYYAHRRRGWAFLAGMVLYSMDGAIFIVAMDFLSAAFHAFALFWIYQGYKASKDLGEFESQTGTEIDANAVGNTEKPPVINELGPSKWGSCPKCGSTVVAFKGKFQKIMAAVLMTGFFAWLGYAVFPLFWLGTIFAAIFMFVSPFLTATLVCRNCKYEWDYKKQGDKSLSA